jgi:hypothetical protein
MYGFILNNVCKMFIDKSDVFYNSVSKHKTYAKTLYAKNSNLQVILKIKLGNIISLLYLIIMTCKLIKSIIHALS